MTAVINLERETFRRCNINYSQQKSRSIDSLFNYETVKYYVAEKFEVNNFTNRITEYQKDDFKSKLAFRVLHSVQKSIVSIVALIGSLYSAYLVVDVGTFTSGQYVLFVSYVYQIYWPLNRIGSCYK